MYSKLLKLTLISLTLVSGVLIFGGGSAAAANASYVDANCQGAPYENWGNHDTSGEGAGVMASLRVKAFSVDSKNGKTLINTDYTLTSSGNPKAQIFNYQNWKGGGTGTVRTDRQTFSTGEWLTGGAGGPYRCNGWSVLAPGRVVKDENTGKNIRLVGNGWILDCKDSTGANVQYSFSNLGKPDGQNGYWTLAQWNQYTNKMEENPTKIAPGSGGVSTTFKVDNGENNTVHLIWHPDPGWKLRGHTGINKTTAAPGQKVKFDHTVTNTEGSPANYQWRISTKRLGESSWTPSSWQSESNVNAGGKKPNQTLREYEIPESASNNQTYCQRIEYTNKYGGGSSDPSRLTSSPANSNWPDDDNNVKCVTVVKGAENPTPQCRYLYAKSRGAYKPNPPNGVERATRTLVKVDNVQVTEAAGGATDYSNIPASSGTASKNDHMTWDVYNGTNTKFAAIPDDSGSKSQADRLWKFQPTSQNIRVVVIDQWFYPGGDNPATKNKVETDYNKGWHNISVSDQTIACVSATCTMQATGSGPGGRVLAGDKQVTLTATFTNTGPPAQETRLFGVSFTFGGRTSDNTGKIPPGQSGQAQLDGVTAPMTPNYTDPASGKKYWVGGLASLSDLQITDLTLPSYCLFSVPLYDEFKVQPLASALLKPTDEAPTSFEYWGGAFTTNNATVTMNWGACAYREAQEPRDGNPCRNPMLKPALGRSTFNSTIQKVFQGTETNIQQPVEAGNQFCTVMDVEYTSGYIGSDGTIVDGVKDPAITPWDSCDVVANKPYFKAYGKGMRVGGGFNGATCEEGGLLAGWNDYPTAGGPNRGSGSQLSALARIKITGVASAQASGSNAPDYLSFANSGAGVSAKTTSPDSPTLGGDYRGAFCFDDVSAPAESANAIPATPTVDVEGSQSYTGNKSISGGTVGVNKNQSIFVSGGNVYINDNIEYEDWDDDASKIPSFVLRVDGNIYIGSNVTRLDGLYVATGKIYTCATGVNAQVPASGLYGTCNKQLQVNGAFIATQINLMRTYGSLRNSISGENTNTPNNKTCSNLGSGNNGNTCAAEYFNFSPEMFLSNPAIQKPNNGARGYDSIVSLPPVL